MGCDLHIGLYGALKSILLYPEIPRSDEMQKKIKILEEYKVYSLEKLLVLKQSCLQGISRPRQNVIELENGSDAFLIPGHKTICTVIDNELIYLASIHLSI